VKPKAILSWSSGKDCAWALHLLLVVDTPARSPLCGGRVPGRQGGVESSRSPLCKLLNLLFDLGEPLPLR
jgi:hypothetical protein